MNYKKTNKNINWFFSQIPILKKENIIDDNTEQKIVDYYTNLIKNLANQNKTNHSKTIIAILGIISALFIGGGIILLIAYNWQKISREIKTVVAFILLVIPQILCFYFLFINKNKIGDGLKEGLSLFLALIFGAVVAFIGQIYRLPPNNDLLFLIWGLSTLAIVYIFESVSTIILYFVLTIALTSSMQLNNEVGSLFYPMLLAIIPLYLKFEKNESIVKKTFFKYILIASTIGGLGIALEKALPGIWIVCYSNLFVLFLFAGFNFEEKNNSLIYSPLKVAGIVGLFVLLCLFVMSWVWDSVGFSHYRGGGKFNEIAAISDYVIAIGLFISNIFFTISYIKKDFNIKKFLEFEVRFIPPLISFFITLLYIFVSFNIFDKNAAAMIVGFFALLLLFYFTYSRIFNNIRNIFNNFIVFLTIPIFIKMIEINDRSDNYYNFLVLIPAIFLFFYLFGTYFAENKLAFISKGIKIIGILGVAILAFIYTFIGDSDLSSKFEYDFSFFYLISIFIGTYILLYFIFSKKIRINISAILLPLIILVFYLSSFYLEKQIMAWIINLFILVFCLNGLYNGFKLNSLLIINIYTIFLVITILFRFFDENVDILTRAVVFIISGIIILILNTFLSKRKKKENETN